MNETIETSIVSGLYDSIRAADTPRQREHWHATDLARCPKEAYLLRQNVTPIQEVGGGKILRWQAGHVFEAQVRPHLQKLMPNLLSNKRFTNEALDLTGELDNYDPDTKTLWEIKTVSTHAVSYKKVADTRHHLRGQEPYPHHAWQQHAYVILMGEKYPVEHIGYLYITLDGLIVPYLTDVDPLVLEAVKDRIALLNTAWQNQQAPECLCGDQEHPFYKPVMQYCSYKTDYNCCEVKV